MMSRVMLATRNDQLRRYLSMRLNRAGCVVTRVSDYDSALTLLNEAAYDVLLATVDSDNPEELAFAREAQEIDPDMRVMFITGFSAVAMRRPEERGAGETLGRPVHLNHLADEIRRLTAA